MKAEIIENERILNFWPIRRSNDLYIYSILDNQKKGIVPLSSMHTSIHGALIVWFLGTKKYRSEIKCLEMGTFCGANIAAIAKSLPYIEYTTVDIDMNDERLSGFYNLGNDVMKQMKVNRGILVTEEFQNVSFLKMSTTKLYSAMAHTGFDLYWIDADHESFGPYNDLNYALTTWNDGSIIMMDDIILEKGNPSIEAIKYLRQDYEFDYFMVQKREESKKYVAVIHSKKNAIVSYLKSKV